ncbi:nudix hydrolase 3-like [Spodoptera litura]|uniref:Nudix hydrolase 3-like n=1 Tax=Spodoptera litura TaxID=69820 RepID=A0A9J7E269_SPOLT|nr:nudix hydrolase 3-like [Spodoptera litura]
MGVYLSPVLSSLKTLMWFCPEVILSSCWRENCICNIKKLPSIDIRGGPTYHTDTFLVPLCVVNHEVCLLYTKRSDVMPCSGTKVTFPGGGKVLRDETVYEAAAYHTYVDIGIRDIKFWTKMGQVLSRGPNIAVTPVIGELTNFNMSKVKANENIADVFTVPLRLLCDPFNHGHCRYDGVVVPVYAGGKYHIWGITAMITHRFLYALLSREFYNPHFFRNEMKFRLMKP